MYPLGFKRLSKDSLGGFVDVSAFPFVADMPVVKTEKGDDIISVRIAKYNFAEQDRSNSVHTNIARSTGLNFSNSQPVH
jgi:hypothetical protein